MTISKTCIANNISLLEPWGFLLIGHTASRRIKTADKHLQVLNLFTLLFYEVTEIIEKTARIAEFYWSKLQTSACIRELQLLLPITLSHLKFAHHKTTFSVSFKDVHILVILIPLSHLTIHFKKMLSFSQFSLSAIFYAS